MKYLDGFFAVVISSLFVTGFMLFVAGFNAKEKARRELMNRKPAIIEAWRFT